MKFSTKGQSKFLISLLLPTYGWKGQGQYFYLGGAFRETKNEIRWRQKWGWDENL